MAYPHRYIGRSEKIKGIIFLKTFYALLYTKYNVAITHFLCPVYHASGCTRELGIQGKNHLLQKSVFNSRLYVCPKPVFTDMEIFFLVAGVWELTVVTHF